VVAATLERAAAVEELVRSGVERATAAAGLQPGMRVVLTAGSSVGASGTTNLVVLRDLA
jgi:pyruvate kinase